MRGVFEILSGDTDKSILLYMIFLQSQSSMMTNGHLTNDTSMPRSSEQVIIFEITF